MTARWAEARERMMQHGPSRGRGFTLIEVMIALVVVAILAAIALPSYRDQMRKSTRAQAQAFLSDMASRQQQFLVDKRRYAPSVAALNMAAPADVGKVFDVAVAAAAGPPPTFVITATASGDQAKDKCPVMTIDNAGNRTPATCW
jgi:type IV pilus assembly protein PilE